MQRNLLWKFHETTEFFHFSELRLHALNDLLFISSG